MIVYSIGLMVDNVVGWTSEPEDIHMTTTLTLRGTRKRTVVAVALERLKVLVAAATRSGEPATAEARPYSFMAECECPGHCPRDHENE